jgi:diguanylate cyclase (GGDEF)-like protein
VHTGPRTPAVLLAALYAISGLLCWVGAAVPMDPRTPVDLLWALGTVGLGGGLVLAAAADRVRPWILHAGLVLLSLLIGVLAWRSVTAVGIVGLGPVLVAVGLYAAHFLPLPAARLHAGLLLLSAGAGAWAAAPSGFLASWIAVTAAVATLTEVQGRLAARLRTSAGTDALTGVANRRAWVEFTSRQLARAARSGEPLSVAILDLDDFKEVNDRNGHGAGDALLRDLCASWSRRLRRADLLGRYGGDEFVLCLPATDEHAARELVTALDATHPSSWTAGTATAEGGDTVETLLARADAELYRNKRSRRTT